MGGETKNDIEEWRNLIKSVLTQWYFEFPSLESLEYQRKEVKGEDLKSLERTRNQAESRAGQLQRKEEERRSAPIMDEGPKGKG